MTDIERLEKYIQRREKWKHWVPTQELTDMQALRKQEHVMWEGIILFGFGLFNIIDGSNFFEPFHLIALALVLGFIVYLGMEVSRTDRLREIFERTAIQNASDLINDIKRRSADQTQQDKPAS